MGMTGREDSRRVCTAHHPTPASGFATINARMTRMRPYHRSSRIGGCPSASHCGAPWGPKTSIADANPLLLVDVARKYPDLRIVLCHMGGCIWHKEAAVMVWHQPNIWLELSGLYEGPVEPLDEMIRSGTLRPIYGTTFVEELIQALTFAGRYERVVYGSDYPCHPMASYRRFMEAVIPKEHHTRVFRTNMEELYGVKLDALPSEAK